MAENIARYDWARHPLGPIEAWPASLKSALSMVLNSRTPSYLVWTAEYFGFYNDAYLPQLGLKADAALGARFCDVWAEAWHLVGPIADRAFAGDGSDFQDLPIVTERTGVPETSYFTFAYSPVRDEAGRVAGVMCSTMDVTRQVVALAKSKATEERLQLSLEASGNIGTWTYDLEEGLTYVDERLARLFQVDAVTAQTGAELARFTEMIHDKDRDRVRGLIARAIETGELYEAEYRVPQRDGSDVSVMTKGKVFVDPLTGKRRFAGVAVDITERKKSEQSLQESEAKFRTIADAMPQMVWSTLSDGYHDYYNQQWYDYTGMPPGSTDGEGWNGMFHPDDQARAWAQWAQCLQTGETYEIEYRLRHHTGEYRWVLGRALPIRGEDGTIIRWMGTCTDIHAHKEAEEDLRMANQQKDEFLAMLAHELRNPLAPISTSAQLLSLPGISAANIKRAGEVIGRQVNHMTRLVDDLLDVSRVTRGLVSLANDRCDLHGVLASALEQTRPLIESRGHRLEVDAGDDHPVVLGDRTRLVQVLSNLLSNAAKYTPQQGLIQVALRMQGAQLQIAVRDNGSGIEPDLLPRVFDLFTQGHRTPDRSQGGLGLGLALVKNIVALHNGSVTAYSEGSGKGSEFVITLPVVDSRGASDGRDPQRAATQRQLAIMVVDDNVDAAHTLAALLECDGHAVTVHADGNAALESARKKVHDAYILDIGLPDIDGYELVRRIRTLAGTRQSHFIALTGYGQSHDRGLALAAGFHQHCVKPVDFGELQAILAQL